MHREPLVREKLFSERLIEPQITENKRQIQFVESFKLKRGTFFNLSEFILFEKKKKTRDKSIQIAKWETTDREN